jgi:hypothetical protein
MAMWSKKMSHYLLATVNWMSMEYISDIGYWTLSNLTYCILPATKSGIKYVQHLRWSKVNHPFTPDTEQMVKYIKSRLWWHLQLTITSTVTYMNEALHLIPPPTVPPTTNTNTIIWWYTTCNCSSHWRLKLKQLHTFTDWMQHFIKTVWAQSWWPSLLFGSTERKLITSSHIRCRMVECVFPSVMSPFIRVKGIVSITYYRSNKGVGLWIQNSGTSF